MAGYNMGMKSVKEYTSMGFVENYKKIIFKMDWVFSSFFDKLFLIGLLIWSVWNLWRFIF